MSLENLLKQRQSLYQRIELELKIVTNYSTGVDRVTVQIGLDLVKDYAKELSTIHTKIIDKVEDDEDIQDASKVFVEISQTLRLMKSKLLMVTASSVQAEGASSESPAHHFRLESIKLPTFSGKFIDWESFRDLFISAVDKNPSLSSVEKMVYLKTSLTGEALNIISSFPTTDASYTDAWDLVTNRFSNPREIAFSHLRKLYDLPKAQDSSIDIRKVIDTVNELTRSLKTSKVPVEHWNVILVFWILKKLDSETRRQWLLTQTTELPFLQILLDFLENRARALDDTILKVTPKSDLKKHTKSVYVASTVAPKWSSNRTCADCGSFHSLHNCDNFKNRSISDRKELVKKAHLCFNCLARGHGSKNCSSKFTCKVCGQNHHSLLHLDTKNTYQSTSIESVQCSFSAVTASQVLLETAIVDVVNAQGVKVPIRIFVDKGSEAEFVTDKCVKKLGFTPSGCSIHVTGLGGANCGDSQGKVLLTLHSKVQPFSLQISADVMTKVTRGNLPQLPTKRKFCHLNGLPLADPQFWKSLPVDVILGARYASRIKLAGIIHGPPGTPSAEETRFGWMLSGPISLLDDSTTAPNLSSYTILIEPTTITTNLVSSQPAIQQISGAPNPLLTTKNGKETVKAKSRISLPMMVPSLSNDSKNQIQLKSSDSTSITDCKLYQLLSKFWETEEPNIDTIPRSYQDEICEKLYASGIARDINGRYVVKLPFLESHPPLGYSLSTAVRRFMSVERRLDRDLSLRMEYRDYFKSHLLSGVMELIPPDQINCKSSESYYMPYREVRKNSSSSTKVRIVFDCSAKTIDGPSLNGILYSGPKLQVDLLPLLLRFRTYPYAISADVVKFFNQFVVDKAHQDYQRLIYRDSPSDTFSHYRMTRVTFGVTSAPFLAIRSLNQLFLDESEDSKLQTIIREDTLVDNILTGSFSVSEGLQLQKDLLRIMSKGQLQLRKWASNSHRLLEAIPVDHRDSNIPLTITDKQELFTLGLRWYPGRDTFSLIIPVIDDFEGITKRKVLSVVAKIFDPLGWVSPVTIRAKIFMQVLWKSKIDWDTVLPEVHLKKWKIIMQDLISLEHFSINRCYSTASEDDMPHTYDLFGFSDASSCAYAAVVFMKTTTHLGISTSTLVAAKTKVAPVKGETTPRLELNGARLLASLLKTIRDSLRVKINSIQCYTDSTSVLGWVNSTYVTAEAKNIYVLNRIRFIQRTLPDVQWKHVPGVDNPADCASRGITSTQLLSLKFWKSGPKWLIEVPVVTNSHTQVTTLDNHEVNDPILLLIHRNSSLIKTQRIMAWILRFIRILKFKSKDPPFLLSTEIESAMKCLILSVQRSSFKEEYLILSSTRLSNPPKRLKFLNPFMDEEGFLRVGGRLNNADVALEKKHPLLLPKKHHFSNLIARHYHYENYHAGPTLLLCLLRERFWILGGSTLVKQITRSCITCHRHNPKPLVQFMAALPKPRVTLSRPFCHTGMDFAGPFEVAVIPGRKPKILKSYFCIFVCMAIKAVHLEFVGDLSTPSFLGALKRFVSRRGLPQGLYSDGGRNFVGAKSELLRVISFSTSEDFCNNVGNFCSGKGIKFHFNPPLSPHHGGLYEAAVKSVKYHLRRIIGDRHLSIEEMWTILCQIEGLLNSRPLVAMSSDPSDISALTPAHFLIGSTLHSVPEEDLSAHKISTLRRWDVTQQIVQQFWKRFHLEYLQVLQSRPKWLKHLPNIEPGTLVLVKESEASFSTHKWNLARVVQVFPGTDGIVRVVELKTSNGSILRRPIVKISPVPLK